jgi:hypothetical protein
MPNPEIKTFTAILEKPADWNTLHITIPFSVQEVWATKGQLRVCGTIEGIPYRKALAPMGGQHYMGLDKAFRTLLNKQEGDTVTIVMQPDTEPRIIEIPEEMQTVLIENDLLAHFEKMAFTHRKEWILYYTEAQKPETRSNRLVKMVEKLQADFLKL